MKLIQVRPKLLVDFQGKKKLKQNLEIYIRGAKTRKEPLDHCLFYGPAGVGKTSIAHVIANELNTKIKCVQGPEILEKPDILNILYSIKDFDVLFIDEIHAINIKCFEMLYSAMEDFKINIEIGKDFNKKITTVAVPKFTLIGATTKLGLLPTPFEERFGIVSNIKEYSEKEIMDILIFSLKECNLKIKLEYLVEIANRSKGIPRIAKRILSRFVDHFQNEKILNINNVLNQIGVFEKGLDEMDLRYLKLLEKNKRLGLKTICQLLNVDERTLLNKIEPYLIKCDFICKNINGRSLTELGIDYLKKHI